MIKYSEDLKLVEQLLSAQRAAWQQFVVRYQGVVYSRIRVTCNASRLQFDASDVDDICAEVFAALLSNDMACLRRFRGESSIATWISVIARRVCLRQLQKLKKSQTNSVHESPDELKSNDNQVHQLIQKEEASLVWSSVEKLGYGDQKILGMFFREELSYTEISQRMGISINTVGPKLHRAQKRLKKMLGNERRSK